VTAGEAIARRARLDDVADISRVCAASWRATYRDLHSHDYIEQVIRDFYSEERIEREVRDPRGWDGWFVAERDGEVVGAGGGGLADDGQAEIYVLYLEPSVLRQGIGTVLLAAITEPMRAAGAHEQRVTVMARNKNAIAFYRARGFEHCGERDPRAWYPAAVDEYELVLCRPI
jgi:ribosomal protein S18 acetylase RimI-like enzyme